MLNIQNWIPSIYLTIRPSFVYYNTTYVYFYNIRRKSCSKCFFISHNLVKKTIEKSIFVVLIFKNPNPKTGRYKPTRVHTHLVFKNKSSLLLERAWASISWWFVISFLTLRSFTCWNILFFAPRRQPGLDYNHFQLGWLKIGCLSAGYTKSTVGSYSVVIIKTDFGTHLLSKSTKELLFEQSEI